jgi:hypothetical protein
MTLTPEVAAYFKEMGRKGGVARAKSLSREDRVRIAKMGGRPKKLDSQGK